MFLFPNLNTCEQRSRSPAGEEIVRVFEFARRRRGSGVVEGDGRGELGERGQMRDWENVGWAVTVTVFFFALKIFFQDFFLEKNLEKKILSAHMLSRFVV